MWHKYEILHYIFWWYAAIIFKVESLKFLKILIYDQESIGIISMETNFITLRFYVGVPEAVDIGFVTL